MARSCTASTMLVPVLVSLLTYAWIPCTGAYYHLATPVAPCRLTTPQNSTLDLVCKYSAAERHNQPCQFQSLTWQRISMLGLDNINDSAKFGIWKINWGLPPGEHMSLLRIRDVQPSDLALYRCRVICSSAEGSEKQLHEIDHQVELCMDRKGSKTSLCSVHAAIDGKCHKGFRNELCDNACDNEAHLFDGFDCVEKKRRKIYHDNDADCKRCYNDGTCDQRCNKVEYGFDGGDCIKSIKYAKDTIVIHLSRKINVHSYKIIHFARRVTKLLRTVTLVHKDQDANDGIYPWEKSQSLSRGVNKAHTFTGSILTGSVIYLKLVISDCKSRCFTNAGQAATFIASAIKSGWDPGISIRTLGVLTEVDRNCPLENNTMLHIRLRESASPNMSKKQERKSALSPLMWTVIVSVGVGAIAVCVLAVLVIRALRLGKTRKTTGKDRDVSYIRANKEIPPGEGV